MTAARPAAILLDWDNTLIDSWPTIHAANKATFEAMGHVPWTMEETKARVRRSLRETFPELFGERWEEARDIFYKAFHELHLRELAPIPGVEDMLIRLSDAGFYLAVVSNKQGETLRAEARHLGWDHYFGALVGAGDAARDKPARDPMELALAPSGIVCGGAVWYVGDTGIDMECAHGAACIPVLLRPVPPLEDEFAGHPPRHRFTTPAQLLAGLDL